MTQRTFRAVLRSIEHPLLPRLLVLVGIPVACPLPPGAGKVDSAEGMATLEAMSSHHNFRQGTRAKICWFQFCSSPPSIQHQFPSIASGKRSVACAVPVARSSAVIPVRRVFFIAHHSSEEAVQWTKYLLTLFPCKAPVANLGSRKRLEGKLVVFALMLAVSALTLWYWQQPISPLLLRPTYRPR